MDTTPQSTQEERRRRAPVPLAITAWLAVSAVAFVTGAMLNTGGHNQTVARGNLVLTLWFIAALVFILGPAVIAALAMWTGSIRAGVVFLAIAAAAGVVILSSEIGIYILSLSWLGA